MAKICVQGLSKVFQTTAEPVMALDDLTFDVAENQFVSLVGPSGCGKTTLLNIVAGFEEPTAGSVTVDGVAVSRPGPDRGVVFQEPALFPWLSIEENVAFGLRLRRDRSEGSGRAHAAGIRQTVDALLERVGLTPFRRRYPAELSGGMRQRVSIARVLALDPTVLLMDEPFGALDAMTRQLMQEFLLQIWDTRKKTVIFITHDISEAIFLADDVYIMTARPGRLKAHLSVDLPRPRRLTMMTEAAFQRLRDEALSLIHEEARRALAQAGEMAAGALPSPVGTRPAA